MTWAPVLSERSIVSDSTMPAPSSPLGASPVPVTTGIPGTSPSASAASAVISPATAREGLTGGSRMLGISTASSRSGDQLRQRASNSNDAEPSPGSVAAAPVIRRRISSLGDSNRFVRHQIEAPSSRIHAAVAAMKPVASGLPAISISRWAPTFAVTSAACRADRWSAQMTAGVSTRSFSPRKTAPCIWPEKPTPPIETPAPDHPTAWCTAVQVACHQASGSCSAQPGCGRITGYSALPVPRTIPSRSTTSALTEDVPRSMPRNASLMGRLDSFVVPADGNRCLEIADRLIQRSDGGVEPLVYLAKDGLIDGHLARLWRDGLLPVAHRANRFVHVVVHARAEST